MNRVTLLLICLSVITALSIHAAIGDPQVKTDHPWYPGELSCSTFERLFKTEAELYTRVTGRKVETDEDKALAAYYWRNLNYWHGEEGFADYWGGGPGKGGDSRTREYWTGLFAHGFGLCGTTHSQWNAEMEALLGHCRSRNAGVSGHSSFEVLLKGGPYGDGKWVLLDHDISTVIFDKEGSRLLSISEIKADLATYKNPGFKPERQRGWRVGGLHDSDPGAYSSYASAEYLSGYAGNPPKVHLRAGESLRRYLQPGLDDGKTFVFWGHNYKTKGIPGPERWGTWVNQPEKMFNAKNTAGSIPGQARFANAVYTYKPDFKGGSYKEGVIDEGADFVTFEFYTPYMIACTPATDATWGVYEPGGTNGLVLRGKIACPVKVSTDQGANWIDAGTAKDGLDLTPHVKGHQQYWLRFGAAPKDLADSGLVMKTVCQTSVSTIPRLKNGGTQVTFLASGEGVISAGPNRDQAEAHVVDGKMGSSSVTLELSAPRKEAAVHLYAGAHVASGNPPNPDVKYNVDYSADGGKTWQPVVKDWSIVRHADEPKDFWSQSMLWGDVKLAAVTTPVRVRFTTKGKTFIRVEAHLVYKVQQHGATTVTFGWKEKGETKTDSHVCSVPAGQEETWAIKTGDKVETLWVDYAVK
jgi:hypothetical protein